MNYTSSGGLDNLRDTWRRFLDATANSNKEITQFSDWTGRLWKYEYSPSGDRTLTAYVDPENKRTEYQYSTDRKLQRIIDPRGSATKIVYDSQRRVTKIVRVTDTVNDRGPTTSFSYSTTPSSPCNSTDHVGKTVVTAPNGHDASGNPIAG